MPLREYRAKRNFRKTAEPRGDRARRERKSRLSFVVQKHDASHLHFDFRLALDGVLLSWAVPKGPSLNPDDKRLAMQVEDHPLDYGGFEGTIPQGEYGGGTVMLWDRGTWQPHDDPRRGLRKGHLGFTLHGERLRGDWSLVRLGKANGAKPSWLLIKKRDAEARPGPRGDVAKKYVTSVAGGRTMQQIAEGAAAKPRGKKPRNRKPLAARGSASRKRKKPRADVDPAGLSGAAKGRLPSFIPPQLATSVVEPPPGDGWLHEMKFDGYRMFCRLDRGNVRFVSRNGKDWTARLHTLVEPLKRFNADRAALDAEVVVLDDEGVSSFQLLQNAFRGESSSQMTLFVFDLLHLDGYKLTATPLVERKQALADLIAASDLSSHVQYSEHLVGDAAAFLKSACHRGLEGIVSKRAHAPYRTGRGGDWLKIKCRKTQEFVIGGFTKPRKSRVGFGSLLLGYYDRGGKLIYSGRVGTGFDDRGLHDLHRRLERLKQPRSPFASTAAVPGTSQTTWVRPELVGQIEFANWTSDGLLRQASFEGLREDKPAADVRRDLPVERKARPPR